MAKPNREQKRKMQRLVQKAKAQGGPSAQQQPVIDTNYLLQEIGGQHVELRVLRERVQGLMRENAELTVQSESPEEPEVVEDPPEPTEEELTGEAPESELPSDKELE